MRLRHFHGVVREGVRLLHRTGGEDDAGKLAVPGGQDEFQLFLPGARGHPRGGAGTHAQGDHHRRLQHPRKGKGFHHEREAAAGSGHHRARSRVGCADRHVEGSDLVLRLLEDQSERRTIGREPEENAAPGSHRVSRGELATSRHRAQGKGFVSREDQPGTERCRGKPERLRDAPRSPFGPQPKRFPVLFEEIAAEIDGEEPIRDVEGHTQGKSDDPRPHHVPEDRAPRGGRKFLQRCDQDLLRHGPWDRIGQGEPLPVEAGQEVGNVRGIQGKEDVRIRPPRADRGVHDAHGAGVPSTADTAHVILGGVEVVPRCHGHAGDERPDRVNALPGAARNADVGVHGNILHHLGKHEWRVKRKVTQSGMSKTSLLPT